MTLSHEDVQSAISYGTATGGFAAGMLADAAVYAQHLTIFVALLVGLLRLVYDGTRLWRYLRRKQDHEQGN